MTQEPPRLTYNRQLASEYVTASGITARFPKVTDQIECIPIVGLPHPFAYNPTIIDEPDGILLVARYHETTPKTKLFVAVLNTAGAVLRHYDLSIPGEESAEDPKLFTLDGRLRLSWVHSRFPEQMLAVVKHGDFSSGNVASPVQPEIGHNDWTAIEKNWVFFDHEGDLWCIYQTSPEQVAIDKANAEWRVPGPNWPYGPPRGGTLPIEYEGEYLRFFHSTLWNELSFDRWRYYLGAYTTEMDPPFRVRRVSRKPILYGSEADDLSEEDRKACFHHKSKIVFCSGAVQQSDHWLLSVGVNDSSCVLAKVFPQNLHL